MPQDQPPEPIDPIAKDLIRRKARRLVGRAGLTGQDRTDVEQELTRQFLQRRPALDPQRALVHAYLATVIQRLAANLLRDRRAQKRDHRRCHSLNVPTGDASTDLGDSISQREQDAQRGRHKLGPAEQADLRIDLAQVLAALPTDLRELAERLQNESITEAARAMGVPRTTLYERRRRLRQIFERAGLQKYLDHVPSGGARAG